MHTMLALIFSTYLSGMTVLNNIILLITQSRLSAAQAILFECLNKCMPTHTTATYITDAPSCYLFTAALND